MATRCTKCGAFLTEGERFCPNCGENAPQIIPPPVPQYGQTYGQPGQPGGSGIGAAGGQGGAGGGYASPQNTYQPARQYQQGYQQTYQNSSAYSGIYTKQTDEMGFGKWFGLILLTNLLGFISTIILIVFAVSSGPEARKNYCRAMLLFKVIVVIIGFILIPILVAIFSPAIDNILYDASSGVYNEYYSEAVAFISGIIR